MDKQKNSRKISAIVPTYNEAQRIERVLQVLVTCPFLEDIIVVDDGSTDSTAKIVKKYQVRYIRFGENRGKGAAMEAGVREAKHEVIFFVDADVQGLTHDIIEQITDPVLHGDVDMFIGMRNRKMYYLHYVFLFVPLLGGERALTKKLWDSVPDYYKHRFRVEAGLNFYARYYGTDFQYKVFKGLSQVIKEKKYGFADGFVQRLRMFGNIVSAQIKLHFDDIPESARNTRLLAFISLQSLIGMLCGSLLLVAAYFGPKNFIYAIFTDELQSDPHTPFIDFLLNLADVTAVSTIVVVGGFLLVSNLFTCALTFAKLQTFLKSLLYKVENNKTEEISRR